MDGQSLDIQHNQRFWDGNKSAYQGAKNSAVLIELTRGFLGKRILDAGAGDGTLVATLRKELTNTKTVGVDLAPKSEIVERGDLTDLQFTSGEFDTVFCAEVIEHLTPETTGKVLAELTRVLKPDGHLVLTTPYNEKLSELEITCPECECHFHRWGHVQNFIEDDFRTLALAAGLTPLEVYPARLPRLRRFRYLGGKLLKSKALSSLRNSKRKQTLIMVAKKMANSNKKAA
ncbi:hypothetical protein Pla110_12400 [Polystyrenella longa]|uniref:Uncharacterized protein n=1 Tax=Polystyrenella longa TaxID=2528007 RepID=A0A518CJX0_9PLAN|nr:class I SAM-dependent methyltransferase [Polystyrenella longa]QDU79529.1 hypothetical protein Pla110_12400 [Polystyrenella longa]